MVQSELEVLEAGQAPLTLAMWEWLMWRAIMILSIWPGMVARGFKLAIFSLTQGKNQEKVW